MPEPSCSKELPVSLLTDPVMIEACQARDFGRIFRLVKARAGVYPSMIARRCDLTPSRVGEVIAGRRQLLHMDVIERISDGLRIPGHMLGLARRSWETPPNLEATPREPTEAPTSAIEPLAAGLPGRTSTASSPLRPSGISARRRWTPCIRRSRTTGAGTTNTAARPYGRPSSASSATSSISSRSSALLHCGTACTASRPNWPGSPDGPTSTPASTTRHAPTSLNPSDWPRPSTTASSWPTSSPV